MNVLLYTGNGAAKGAIYHTSLMLKSLLSKNYDIMEVDANTIINEPWQSTTALLVFPGGRDLPYLNDLSQKGQNYIREYVKTGGNYLGICAGAYFGSSRCEFEINRPHYEVVGERDLSFSKSVAKGSVTANFVYGSESGSKAMAVQIDKNMLGLDLNEQFSSEIINLYVNGGPYFEYSSEAKNERILAYYLIPTPNSEPKRLPAIIESNFGKGKAILSGPHLEYSPNVITQTGYRSSLNSNTSSTLSDHVHLLTLLPSLISTEKSRLIFLRSILSLFSLKLNPEEVFDEVLNEKLFPKITAMSLTGLSSYGDTDVKNLLSYLNENSQLSQIFENNEGKTKATECLFFQDEFKFLFLNKSNANNITESEINTTLKNSNLINDEELRNNLLIKIYYENFTGDENELNNKLDNAKISEKVDEKSLTHFNPNYYIEKLKNLQKTSGKISFGTPILYGEVVGSTQTLLEKNFKLLRNLNDGFVCVGSHQIAGRGRGRNSWISQTGCLQFSFVLKHENAGSVIFIQYLVGLALVESLKAMKGMEDLPVRLKWPNDIYAFSPLAPNKNLTDLRNYKKIGGILVNSNFIDGKFILVIGLGLNVNNPEPTLSVNDLRKWFCPDIFPLSQEEVLANFFCKFEEIYRVFNKPDFPPFANMELSNQIVTLSADSIRENAILYTNKINQEVKVKITGIESSTGLLKAVGLNDNQTYLLQPDGNSFDFLQGLIKRKA
ncbi:biotin holocarboxylase synthetase [Clydaea vesicula]|uniref:Biotin holocarboxylase synthetase n=1 Tax=Clydaea vesicula TaxID=447962 RepID=A0AAD5U6C9_9FUNG|nr:biotin holocarboxylase synthetase [Clydaea vesicula]